MLNKNKQQQENPKQEIGYIKPRAIVDEMKDSYIDYAMSVIVSRALPDVRDGLKPVHRRILYTMGEMGLKHNAKFRKSATVVGTALGSYHPHGDQSVYDALVRMAQDFSLRYPLVRGQGNFGSIDGDPAASMRYSEAKLSKAGEEMLKNIEKNTVDFRDNYDGTKKEPVVLPSPLPQLLLNGTLGIAVGMATSIPPHNLVEVCDALIYLLENSKAETEDLFNFIKGPDFPTGGIIYDQKEIINIYSQGRGGIVIRGKTEIIESKKGFSQILITEIPYQVNKSSLVKSFAELVQTKRVDGIKDVRDESDKDGLRIVIDLQRGAFPQKILNRLYKFTNLQKSFHLNMLALVDGIQPKVLSLKEVLAFFISHRKEVIFRRTEFDLDKAKKRAHILEGLYKCLSRIDEVIRAIKKSKDRPDAHNNLMKKFDLTSIQSEAILETKLHILARLEMEKIEKELKEKKKEIKELTAILKSPQKIRKIIKEDIENLKKEYGDVRKTKVLVQKVGEIAEQDLIPQEETVIALTQGGYVKRINPAVYKLQKRGGKGILGMKTRGEDIVELFIPAFTHDDILFFTDLGKVFKIKAYEIPEESRVAKGRGLMNFLEVSSEEKVLSLMSFGNKDKGLGINYLVMVTKNGIIKKTKIEEFEKVRKSGLIAINLKKGDALKKVLKSTGKDEIILVSKKGKAIRFKEKEIRSMGRASAGVRGIRLKKDDAIIGADIIKTQSVKGKAQNSVKGKTENKGEKAKSEKKYLLVIMENGFGKRTVVKQFRIQSRGGTGVKAGQISKKTGDLVASKVLSRGEEDLIAISQKGQVIRTKINSISILGRVTQGVRIMRLDNDKIASIACL